jgi:hypothetical protein
MKSTGRVIGCLIAMAMLSSLAAWSLHHDKKGIAQQYREQYREQGRAQVRAEAVRAGVAEVTSSGFKWRTNDIALVEGEIYDILIEALNKRKEYVKEDSKEKGEGQENSEEKFEKITNKSQEKSESQGEDAEEEGSSPEGPARGSSQGSEEERSSGR